MLSTLLLAVPLLLVAALLLLVAAPPLPQPLALQIALPQAQLNLLL